MKKFSLIALTALACMGITSCDEYTLPNPPAQSNAPEPVFQTDGLKLTSLIGADATIDLPTLTAAMKPVDLFDVTLTDFPSSYDLKLESEFSADEDFTDTEKATLTIDSAMVASLRTGELQQIYNDLVSKDHREAKTLYSRVSAYAVAGTSIARIGGPDVYFWQGEYTVQPNPQQNVIEDDYYLVGNFCGWDATKALPFKHQDEGSVYDHPNFYVTVDVTEDLAKAGGLTWKVLPESSVLANNFDGALGVADLASSPSSTTGNLLEAPEKEAMAYTIENEGSYMIKINMETRKFEVMFAFETMYVPTPASSTTNYSKMMRLHTNDYIHYEGTLYLRNNFWFTGQPSNRGIIYRPDGDTEYNEDKTQLSGKMQIENSGSLKMKVGTNGLYYLKANITDLTYEGVLIPSIQIVGAFNGWDQTSAPDLTHNANFNVWTINDIELEGEFKFCVDHAWTYSYGGSVDFIEQNGGNLSVPQKGKYDVTLSFETYPAHVTIVEK